MDDPILTAIAVALSTRAVEGLTDAGREALASLMHLVRRKATGHRELRASLVAEPTSPEGDDRAVELRRALGDAAARDPDFDQELRRRWATFQQATVRADAVTNTVSGQVTGPVVQARDISGGVHVGLPPQQRHQP
ncbi:hypothetical protein GA0070216_101604 [Micromonospora matsumotoense]|uniref:Uncharacterized protein n=1 Tax=Micromonospora matsumotoense TaxID=121616 RepID=A0A1C4UM49_9ACTN|nr:hypothetical protein [Micromonospora matsumotoense]SCE72712.1 hypothetical protein GA0070216_101604 [Micromonospora matsumotoense]